MSYEAESSGSDHAEHGSEFTILDGAARAYSEAAGGRREELRDALVIRAAPVARRLARRYRDRGEPLDDLEQVALVGLLKAVDGYDPGKGPFGGYLLATVGGELKRHFRDRGWSIRVPRRVQELTAQVVQASAEFTADRARRPTTVELARELRVSEEEVIEALTSSSAYRPVSLNVTLPGDDGTELADTLGGVDGEIGRVEDRLTVVELLCRLPVRERRVLAMRFYGNHTQTEIAEALGISQMHASRLISRALGWLRDALLSDDPLQWNLGRGAPDGNQISVRVSVLSGTVVLELGGELERDTADQLRRALSTAIRRGPAARLRVDLRAVPFVDAAAIAVLIWAGEAAGRAGMRLCLCGARPYVARALATAGLWPFLEPAGEGRAGDAGAGRPAGARVDESPVQGVQAGSARGVRAAARARDVQPARVRDLQAAARVRNVEAAGDVRAERGVQAGAVRDVQSAGGSSVASTAHTTLPPSSGV